MNNLFKKLFVAGSVFFNSGCGAGIVFSGGQEIQNQQPPAYRYHRTIHSIDGRSRQDDGNPLKPGERYAYSYAFRRSDLKELDSDTRLAIWKFINSRNAAPQCTQGFNVVGSGTTENMGIVIGVIECK